MFVYSHTLLTLLFLVAVSFFLNALFIARAQHTCFFSHKKISDVVGDKLFKSSNDLENSQQKKDHNSVLPGWQKFSSSALASADGMHSSKYTGRSEYLMVNEKEDVRTKQLQEILKELGIVGPFNAIGGAATSAATGTFADVARTTGSATIGGNTISDSASNQHYTMDQKDDDQNDNTSESVLSSRCRLSMESETRAAADDDTRVRHPPTAPKSNKAKVETLLSPAKESASCVVPKVRTTTNSAHTLKYLKRQDPIYRNTSSYVAILPTCYTTLVDCIYLR